jgi:hypothetical protein
MPLTLAPLTAFEKFAKSMTTHLQHFNMVILILDFLQIYAVNRKRIRSSTIGAYMLYTPRSPRADECHPSPA